MNYRSIADLEKCIVSNLHRVPRNIDLIVGVPRSGILVASMLALYLNIPPTDVRGLIEGRVFHGGERMRHLDMSSAVAKARSILVIDDSVNSGREMARVRNQLSLVAEQKNIVFGAVYVTEDATDKVDIYFEVCPQPRIFAWNLMHHSYLEHACLDIDGVLCVDPTEEENDDGPRYLQFLKQAKPLFIPTVPVGVLVTCRLEKYRCATEGWLKRYGIKYEKLIMWDLPSKDVRQEIGGHAQFKASIFRSCESADFFIESSNQQAQLIADYSRKPVICIETQRIHLPGVGPLVRGTARKIPRVLDKRIRKGMNALRQRLIKLNRY